MSETSEEDIEPHENDILMGRGGKNNQHVGNEKLRGFARLESENYRVASKKGKSNISRELVKKVRELDPPGRFLRKNNLTGEWEDVGDDIAREKTSQVLRDAVSFATQPKVGQSHEAVQEHPPEQTFDNIPRAASAPPTARRRQWEDMTYATPPHYHPPLHMMPPDFYPPRAHAPGSHSDPSAKRPRYHTNQWEDPRTYYHNTPVRYYSQTEYRRPLPTVPTSPIVHNRVPSEEHLSPSNLTASTRSLPSSPLIHSRRSHDEQISPSTSSIRSIPQSPRGHPYQREHGPPRNVSNSGRGLAPTRRHATLDEFDLFHGELLKSDEEGNDEGSQLSENVDRAF
mmetsp:Transcript_22772/g.34454  ORF Transcript_22772/g.34454 Transcript_22772/m.34454 type:complete len:341 (-) Transcript_22772:72-1094(-)